jgi:hypothetical protein
MYENIRIPHLLKNIPILLIRALPTIYYFAKYANSRIPQQVLKIFHTHVVYLGDSLKLLAESMNKQELKELSQQINSLKNNNNGHLLKQVEETTILLSNFCQKHQKTVEKVFREIRTDIQTNYMENVERLKTLLVINDKSLPGEKKLDALLEKFCFYRVNSTTPGSLNYTKLLVETDFVLFNSTRPTEIHQQVDGLRSYKKPGLALARIEKEQLPDRQAIRHGAQLMKNGFPVLFKVFTPIRLFTSIDKVFMRHHLDPKN